MNSENNGSSTDDSKKRNDREEEGSFFTRSKKIKRSPVKTSEKSEEKLDKLLEMMQNMSTEIQLLRKEQQECNKEMKEIREDNRILRKENENIKKENEKIKKDITELTERMEYLEKEKKRNNIVIHGLKAEKEGPEELKEVVTNFIEKNLKVAVPIKSAKKIGKTIYLAEMESIEGKNKVMKNKNKLRLLKDERIYINNDQTVKEREIQKQIKLKADQERKQGKRVKVGYQRIYINDEEWKWNRKNDSLEIQKENEGISKN